MKYVHACLIASEDRESSFHCSGGPVRLVQACLCAANADKVVYVPEKIERADFTAERAL